MTGFDRQIDTVLNIDTYYFFVPKNLMSDPYTISITEQGDDLDPEGYQGPLVFKNNKLEVVKWINVKISSSPKGFSVYRIPRDKFDLDNEDFFKSLNLKNVSPVHLKE